MANDRAEKLNVVAVRRIHAGREAEYEAAMRDFVRWAITQPGHEGFQVLRPLAGGRDYTTVSRFEDEAARRAFTASEGYRGWMATLGALTEGDPRIAETIGLEGWFTPPGAEAHVPKWKIAVATFLGVLPTATVLDQLLGPRIAGWPYLAGQAAFAASMVTILTWAVMPLATRALGGWLRPQSRVEGDAR